MITPPRRPLGLLALSALVLGTGCAAVPSPAQAGPVGTALLDTCTSAILEPSAGTRVPAGDARVRGYAMATGQPIAKVEVSADGGRQWVQATIERHADASWSWTFWNAALNLPRGEHELVVRAVDGAGRSQPATAEEIWNFPGYLCTAWHRVPVTVG